MTREKARDIYDLNYLISNKKIIFNHKLICKKLEYYKLKFDEKLFMEKIENHSKYYEKEMKSLIFGELEPFDKAVEKIKQWAKE